MSDRIKIGLFSKITQVTVRTLRHYDDLGLLKPAYIDMHTNYRYYSYDQIMRIHQIQALKDSGLSLDQIRALLAEQLSVEDTIKILTAQQNALVAEIHNKQSQLKQIDIRLHQLHHHGGSPKYDIILKQAPPLHVASVRQIIPTLEDMPSYRYNMFAALERWSEQHDCEILQEYVLYHVEEYVESQYDVEIAYQIQPRKIPSEKNSMVQIYELPSYPLVASLIHRGPLMNVDEAILELFTWLGANNYSPQGPVREIHLFGRENHVQNCDEPLVELQIPITKNI